jgi:hypothetical protein
MLDTVEQNLNQATEKTTDDMREHFEAAKGKVVDTL